MESEKDANLSTLSVIFVLTDEFCAAEFLHHFMNSLRRMSKHRLQRNTLSHNHTKVCKPSDTIIHRCEIPRDIITYRYEIPPVSYTHLTLPTKRIV